MNCRAFAASLFAMAVMVGTLPAKAPSDEVDRQLTAALDNWVATFNKHDAQAIATEYSTDCDLVALGGARLTGRAAIENDFAETFAKNPDIKTKITVESRRQLAPDVVIEDGIWEEFGHSQPGFPTKGHYSSVLTKIDGKWQVVHERSWLPTKLPSVNAE